MQKSNGPDQVLQLVKVAITELGGTVSIFPRDPKTPSIRIVQPLHNGRGPDKRLVDEFIVTLKRVAEEMNLSRKLDITSFLETGPDYDRSELGSNEVHKIRIVTLQ